MLSLFAELCSPYLSRVRRAGRLFQLRFFLVEEFALCVPRAFSPRSPQADLEVLRGLSSAGSCPVRSGSPSQAVSLQKDVPLSPRLCRQRRPTARIPVVLGGHHGISFFFIRSPNGRYAGRWPALPTPASSLFFSFSFLPLLLARRTGFPTSVERSPGPGSLLLRMKKVFEPSLSYAQEREAFLPGTAQAISHKFSLRFGLKIEVPSRKLRKEGTQPVFWREMCDVVLLTAKCAA